MAHTRNRIWHGWPLLAASIALFLAPGCGRPPVATERTSADELLRRMAEKYKQAQTYEDVGELKLWVEGAPEDECRAVPFAVAFERPNRLRVHALEASVVADGKQLRAVAQSLAEQVLSMPCPARIKADDVAGDEMLRQAMRGPLDLRPPQLTLLVEDDAIQKIAGSGHPALLPDAEFQGETCNRVAVSSEQGKCVFWISPATRLLRKFEFPLETIRQQYPLAGLWVEFKGARMNGRISPVAFQMEVPQEAKVVSRFVMPGPPQPAPLLSKLAGDFKFVDLEGTPVTRESLAGKIVVLDMWGLQCQWCFEGFPMLDQVYKKYKDNDRVAILAVCTDPPAVSNAQVRQAFERAKLSVPIVRDEQQTAETVFDVKVLPIMVVLGADGSVQDYRIGYDPNLGEKLPQKLEKLLAGENLAQEELDNYQRESEAYQQRLTEVLVQGESATGDTGGVARQPGAAETK